MRRMFVLAVALLLVTVPLSVSAQGSDDQEAAESADTPKPATGLQRWHPEAFVDPASGNMVPESTSSDLELQYLPGETEPTAERKPKRTRGARIAMGILIPVAIGGLAVGITAAVTVPKLFPDF